MKSRPVRPVPLTRSPGTPMPGTCPPASKPHPPAGFPFPGSERPANAPYPIEAGAVCTLRNPGTQNVWSARVRETPGNSPTGPRRAQRPAEGPIPTARPQANSGTVTRSRWKPGTLYFGRRRTSGVLDTEPGRCPSVSFPATLSHSLGRVGRLPRADRQLGTGMSRAGVSFAVT
jgi:hypothetical protein